jgi:hypothetical protein
LVLFIVGGRPTRTTRRERAGAGGNRALLIALVGASVLGIVGLSAAAYFALKDEAPKGRVAADPPPASKPDPPKPPVAEPPKKVEPKEEPKPPSAQEVVRRVKQATVYVRATVGPGQVDMGSDSFAGPLSLGRRHQWSDRPASPPCSEHVGRMRVAVAEDKYR